MFLGPALRACGAYMSGRCASGNVEGWATQCLPTVRVGHAWTLGLVRRPVVLSGMRRWPSEALHGCCVENGFIMETLSGAYSQGSQELSAPAGAC
jgi:hypothetical protein